MSDFAGQGASDGTDPAAPAGWYPVDGGQQRYWDGTKWTEHIAPLAGPTGAPAPDLSAESLAGPDPFQSDPFQATGFQDNALQGNALQGNTFQGGPAGAGSVPFSTTNYPGVTAVTSDDRTMAVLIHVLSIFTGFIGPLIIWLMKKNESAFVDHHGKESLNFQITMVLAWIVAVISILILIGLLLVPVLLVVGLLFPILAAVAANRGEFYRFPFVIRFLS